MRKKISFFSFRIKKFTLHLCVFLFYFLVLSQAPEEEEAFHCRIVCLIQLSKFQEALQAILKQTKSTK